LYLLYRYLRFGKIYRRIYLGEGRWTILESRDYYRLKNFRWYIFGRCGKFYAQRSVIIANEHTLPVVMHREIIKAPKGKLVDHRNSDSLDNRRENLRFATRAQNRRNCGKTRKKTSSKYNGVSREKISRSWKMQIRRNGKTISSGRYKNEIDAAKAYDKAAKKYFGEFARLNFPDPPDKWQGLDYHVAKMWVRFHSGIGWIKRFVNHRLVRRSFSVGGLARIYKDLRIFLRRMARIQKTFF
jgi:hypothetical protein